jgi:hypothetical protein
MYQKVKTCVERTGLTATEILAKATILQAEAINNNFSSPNVSDSNQEMANIVDVGDRLARAIFALAKALEGAR